MLISISPTTNQSAKKRKWKSKMKPTRSFLKDIQSTSILKTRKLRKKNSVSIFIKEVLFQETQSESSTLKESMSKHAVEPTLITQMKSDGSRSSKPQESVTVFWDCITWRAKKLWNTSTNKLQSSTNLRICGASRKIKLFQPQTDSSTIIRSLKSKLKTKRCHFWACTLSTFRNLRMTDS